MIGKSRANAASSSNIGTDELCAAALQRFLIAMPDILDKIVEKAKGGSLPHAKFLFDWAKLDVIVSDEPEESRGPSLAQLLLDKLREDTGESVTRDATDVH